MGVSEGVSYSGESLNHLAFPLGGLGAGMLCLEGNGGINHVSLRHSPDLYHEPGIFASVALFDGAGAASADRAQGTATARILEGPLQPWKIFGPGDDRGNGVRGRDYGFPRFRDVQFVARFPFGSVELSDETFPLRALCTGWSPFIPGDPDRSGLPVAAIEYRLENRQPEALELLFGFHVPNFLDPPDAPASIEPLPEGFYFVAHDGQLAVVTETPGAAVDHCWFRGAWFDAASMLWDQITSGTPGSNPPPRGGEQPSPGASVWLPVHLAPAEVRTIRVLLAWYFPTSDVSAGDRSRTAGSCERPTEGSHRPYYASRFSHVGEVMSLWRQSYDALRQESESFSDCFYAMSLPGEIIEAVAANLSILKSPTVMREQGGRLWAWEGCFDKRGCCYGSCTHVWNYAQAVAHLFPSLERSLRESELTASQDENGHQNFRTTLPISVTGTRQVAAADGQLGGIIKAYREWRISGDEEWLRSLWPQVKRSMEFSVRYWDPERQGVLTEAHHNTYDIEFWGPDGMCSSIYLGALSAFIRMSEALGEEAVAYRELRESGRRYLEQRLFNGEYFVQELEYTNLRRPYDPSSESSPEARERGGREGPKYQYAGGCLSDGIIGAWMARCAGLPEDIDGEKVKRHLESVFRYNYKARLTDHANPQRAGYAVQDEGGLLLCSWPRGGQPSLPFVYSHEVWTGIEYQVASHLLMHGLAEEALTIVRTARARYTGGRRNPFDEYECGHWYARALASYALLQAASGVSYDAVEARLAIAPRLEGDVVTFLSTASGYGLAGIRGGRPFLDVRSGTIEVRSLTVDGRVVDLSELTGPPQES